MYEKSPCNCGSFFLEKGMGESCGNKAIRLKLHRLLFIDSAKNLIPGALHF